MPYTIKKENNEWCVFNKDTGEKTGCSDTLEKAKAHMRTLYANEKGLDENAAEVVEWLSKELKEAEQKGYYDAEYEYVPWGVTSFAEWDEWRKARKIQKAINVDTKAFQSLVWNVMEDSETSDKGAAVKALADEFASRVKTDADGEGEIMEDKSIEPEDTPSTAKKQNAAVSLLNKIKEIVSSFSGSDVAENESEQKELEPTKDDALMLWKEADGTYRWIARYSNNLRDDDKPSEIISSKSHQKFVEKVDRGEAPLPELWLWHRPEWMWGKSTAVAYDESGFALATGYVLPGFEPVAERLAQLPPSEIRVSHGMPVKSIVRDTNDPSVIIEHETREISPLPTWAAANKWTGFVILKEDSEMTVPAEKRKALVEQWGVPANLLDQLEDANARDAQSAKELGIESKETDTNNASDTSAESTETEVEAEGSREEETQTETTAEDKTETESKEVEYPTRQEVADAFAAVVSPLVEGLQELKSQVEVLSKELSGLKQGDEEKIEKAVKDSPPASLAAMLTKSVIGDGSTLLDGRSSLAKSKPKEAQAEQGGDFISNIVRGIVAEHEHNS
jgi:hypothetical protein